MKRMLLLVATLSLAAGSAAAQSLPDRMKQMIAAWNKPTEPFKVIDNIYYVGTNGLASYLITTPQGHILIDTVMPESTAQIEASIAKLGFKVADIKYILNTHAHIDHTGGLAQIKQETGAQMVAGAKDVPLLEGGFYPGREQESHLNFPPVKVDRAVHEGDTVTLGGVIFFCSATVALNQLVGRPTYPGIVDDYKKTYAWAKTVHPDILLAPHPEMFDLAAKRAKIAEGGPNPFVRPGEFNAYLDRLETQFNEGLSKQTAALQTGK